MEYKINFTFSKTGDIRFISHLDLMRLFQRASRRAGLPVAVTKGFTPRIRLSIKKALKLGLEGHEEEALFHLTKKIEPAIFLATINRELPDGIKVLKAEGIS